METDIFWYWTLINVEGLNGYRVGWKALRWETKSNEETDWQLKIKQLNKQTVVNIKVVIRMHPFSK